RRRNSGTATTAAPSNTTTLDNSPAPASTAMFSPGVPATPGSIVGDQPVLDGVHGHLHPAGQVEFLQDVLDVDLDCAFGDVELPRDDLVAGAVRQALDDLALAGGQAGAFAASRRAAVGGLLAEAVDQLGRHVVGNDRFAAGGAADRRRQRVGVDVLDQVAAGAVAQRLAELVGLLGNRQDHHRAARDALHQQLQGFQARQARHVEVEQDDVRQELLGALDPFQAVGSLGHHLEVGLPLQQQPHARAEQAVVVDEQNAYGHGIREAFKPPGARYA